MSALDRREPPATVASMAGMEAQKLAQRFQQLDATNRTRLLETALHMIDGQRDAMLPPREREAKKLVDRITRCLDLIAEAPDRSAIQPRIWRDMVGSDQAELAALGIDYFAAEAGQEPAIGNRVAPPRPLTWRAGMRHVHAAEYEYRRAGMEAAIMGDEGTTAQAAAATREEQRAFRRYVDAVDRQMMRPAPSKAAAAWKLRHRELDGGRVQWEEAIVREQATSGVALPCSRS